MIRAMSALAACGALAIAAPAAWPESARAQAGGPPGSVQPTSPAPGEVPPPPGQEATTAPPPAYDSQPTPAPPSQGQWVFTQQYGWVWMPYDSSYTYVPPGGTGEPEVYVYYPSYGWRWVAAPWVWGVGAWPNFGARGPGAFFWYRSGWWRTPSRWRYTPAPEVRSYEGHERGLRPAPPGREGRARAEGRGRPEGRGSGGEERGGDRREREQRGR